MSLLPSTLIPGTSIFGPAISRLLVSLASRPRFTKPKPVFKPHQNIHRHIMSSAIPSTMGAVILHKTGGPEVLEYTDSYPTPKPSEGQVLVKNTVSGINYIDTYFRTGLYPSPTGSLPLILGQEASGRIVGSGSEKYNLKEGDRVVWIKGGSYSEYTAVPADRVIKIPDDISDEHAVGCFLMGMTGLSLIRESFTVKKGDWVLLHAAAGGVGLLMCQMLRTIGARTIGTAGGPEKCALAKENGAEFVVDYKATSGPTWEEQVKEITQGAGVNVVYDSVGADTWEGSLRAIRRKGTVVFFGNSSGPVPPFPVAKLSANNATILRPTLMNYIYTRKELEYYANELFNFVRGGMTIRIHTVYPLKDAVQAHKDLEGRKTTGKLLLGH